MLNQYKKENLTDKDTNDNLKLSNKNYGSNFYASNDIDIDISYPLPKSIPQKEIQRQTIEAKPHLEITLPQTKPHQNVIIPQLPLPSLPQTPPQDNSIQPQATTPTSTSLNIGQMKAPNMAQQIQDNHKTLLDKIRLDTMALQELQLRSGMLSTFTSTLNDVSLPNSVSNLNANTVSNTVSSPKANSVRNSNASTTSNPNASIVTISSANSVSKNIPDRIASIPPKKWSKSIPAQTTNTMANPTDEMMSNPTLIPNIMPSSYSRVMPNPTLTINTIPSTTNEVMSKPSHTASTIPNSASEAVPSSNPDEVFNGNHGTISNNILDLHIGHDSNSKSDSNAKIESRNIPTNEENKIKRECIMPISNMTETDYDKLPYYKQKTKKNTKNSDSKTKINMPKKNPIIYYDNKLYDLRRSGRFGDGEKLIKDMVNSNIKPTINTMNSLIAIAADYSDVEKVQEIYKNLKLNSLLNENKGGTVVLPRSISNYKDMNGPDVHPNLQTMRQILILYTNEGKIPNLHSYFYIFIIIMSILYIYGYRHMYDTYVDKFV